MATATTERPLTTEQAADYLGAQPRTLHNWRNLRKGPRFLRVGRSIRYRAADLDAWLERNAEPCDMAEAE